jgi:hypothetical protein
MNEPPAPSTLSLWYVVTFQKCVGYLGRRRVDGTSRLKHEPELMGVLLACQSQFDGKDMANSADSPGLRSTLHLDRAELG